MDTKEQSYSLPRLTTFPKQEKLSLCFWAMCKSRKFLLSKILPHTHCNTGRCIDLWYASVGVAPVEIEVDCVEVAPVEVEATAVFDLVVI